VRLPRSVFLALMLGAALFAALLLREGVQAVAGGFTRAGWWIALITLFHVLPLLFDGAAITVLLPASPGCALSIRRVFLGALSRWIGESVNTLLPAAQVGGALAMARALVLRGERLADAGAAVAGSQIQQVFAQIPFTLFSCALLLAGVPDRRLGVALGVLVLLAAIATAIWLRLQHHDLFSALTGRLLKPFKPQLRQRLIERAARLDHALAGIHRRKDLLAASLLLSMAGWFAGGGEVWLAFYALGRPVTAAQSLGIESAAQAARALAFMIPGGLGVQEGGVLLVTGMLGIPSSLALSSSLLKRAREILLAVPGLLVWRILEHRKPLKI